MNRRSFVQGALSTGAAALGGCAATRSAGPTPSPIGRSARTAEHLVYTFRGSPFEIGYQHGKTLRAEIVTEAGDALRSEATKLGVSEPQVLDRVLAKYEGLFREHAPIAMEEIRGMGEGSGLGYAYAFFAATHDGMKIPGGPQEECTAIACGPSTTAGRKVLIGQNKDTGAPLARYRIMRLAYEAGRRMIVLNYPGWIGNLCLTSDGLSFTGNSLYARRPKEETVPHSLLKRMVLEKRSIQEILDSFPDAPIDNGYIAMGDATGRLVGIESANGRRIVRDVSDQAFGHANSILCDELKGFEQTKTVSASSSPHRQANVQRLLDARRGSIDVGDLQRIMADHTDFPNSICRHPIEGAKASTTAAFIANLTDREMDIAIGNPCLKAFKRYSLDF